MNSKYKENFSFGINILFLIFMLFGTLIYADSNGIWNKASDIRGGVFGGDEQPDTTSFTFINDVTLLSKVGIGSTNLIPSLDLRVAGKVGAVEYCDENGANCFEAENVGKGGNVNSSIVEGWPDVIVCYQSSSGNNIVLYLEAKSSSSATYSPTYGEASGSFRYYVSYSSNGNYFENGGYGGSLDCTLNAWSISDLYDNNRAFNLLGGSSIANELEINVPQGAIIPFSLSSCPSGWSEFTQLYGRFIRGVDKSGTNIDPDGQRSIGDIQEDTFKRHSHIALATNSPIGGPWRFQREQSSSPTVDMLDHDPSSYTGDEETRPDNVALLYCIKN